MAEISQEGGKKGGGKKRSKKMSTKIDFTPMVDLGFLLITFFMLTTTLAKNKTMEINMPSKEETDDKTKIRESRALTVILTDKDQIYYYFGKAYDTMHVTGFDPNTGIRSLLFEQNESQIAKVTALQKQRDAKVLADSIFKVKLTEINKAPDALVVMIKTDDKAKYKNLIDMLDELQISNVSKYGIMDLDPREEEQMELLKSGGAPTAAATTTP